jgi:hypothetical protein
MRVPHTAMREQKSLTAGNDVVVVPRTQVAAVFVRDDAGHRCLTLVWFHAGPIGEISVLL